MTTVGIDSSSAAKSARTGVCVVGDDGRILSHGSMTPAAALERLPGALAALGARVAIEIPRAYPKSRVRAQDIVRLAVAAERLAKTLENAGVRVVRVEPRAWKGTIDKVRHHRQLVRFADPAVWARMSSHSRDAFGLALWLASRPDA